VDELPFSRLRYSSAFPYHFGGNFKVSFKAVRICALFRNKHWTYGFHSKHKFCDLDKEFSQK
jgi:hypothetical protein